MSKPIEDYAIVGDCRTAAVVARDGSIDWFCLPRFDSNACFAALLGNDEHGCWRIAPSGEIRASSRRYLPDTLILETTFVTPEGTACVTDFMPLDGGRSVLIRKVTGAAGEVEMRSEILLRCDYGDVTPWVHPTEKGFAAVAGPDMLRVECDLPMQARRENIASAFRLKKGDSVFFLLWYQESHHSGE
jgi:GH15 family glucan-1,4-alpha-glucosidase